EFAETLQPFQGGVLQVLLAARHLGPAGGGHPPGGGQPRPPWQRQVQERAGAGEGAVQGVAAVGQVRQGPGRLRVSAGHRRGRLEAGTRPVAASRARPGNGRSRNGLLRVKERSRSWSRSARWARNSVNSSSSRATGGPVSVCPSENIRYTRSCP